MRRDTCASANESASAACVARSSASTPTLAPFFVRLGVPLEAEVAATGTSTSSASGGTRSAPSHHIVSGSPGAPCEPAGSARPGKPHPHSN